MKRSICFCLIFCLTFLSGCIFEQDSSPKGVDAVSGGVLIPENASTMMIAYYDTENPDATKQKSYQADEKQFRKLCDLIQSIEILPLSEQDVLSFSTLSYQNAADISVQFDIGESLYIYSEGGISRAANKQSDGASVTKYYSVSQDNIHQLKKILIPDFEKDYESLPKKTNAVKTENVNEKNVKEIPLFMPQNRKAFACSDGIIAFHPVLSENKEDMFLRAVKYDSNGKLIWVQNYTDIKLIPYRFGECIQTRDGGFAFSIDGDVSFRQTNENKQVADITRGWLVKCDDDGNIMWKDQLEFRGGSEVSFICETQGGELLTVGTCQTDDGKHYLNSTYALTDLIFTKYDKNGKRIGLMKYGGSDFDSFRSACYSPEIGLVVSGSTQSCDGNITKRKEKGTMLYPREFVTVFDDDLNEKWQYVFEDQNEIYTSYLSVIGKQIYVAGSLASDTGKHNQTAVFKFNQDGTGMKSKIINASLVMGIYATEDRMLLLSVNPSAYCEKSGIPQIYKLDTDLQINKAIDDAPSNAYEYKVVPTSDNGFFTVQMQQVKYLPQPVWMNRSMMDSATVVSRFDADGKLLYRKTYDQNHEVEDIDIVIPLKDGKVIVGR